jgi:ABC-type polysaccharide/polyol phosphate transport system ATPase subunit
VAAAIEVRDLVKHYRAFPHTGRSLKSAVIGRLTGRYMTQKPPGALQGVSLSVQPGEAVAVIGPNGSGKTTLLGVISGVLVPTSGEVIARGRVCVLLEAAVAFHPDLSGRENVILQGMILGMTRREVMSRLDEIIAFARAEAYIEHPVRTLSLGQRARLGFSVAAHLSPDVFLIDEVLAVVDEEFHEACYARLRELQRNGCAVVFVSHIMDQVREICDRALLLDDGRIIADGRTDEIIERYEKLAAEHLLHH